MNLRTTTLAVVALWAVFAVGCKDVESDRRATQPQATEPTAPSPDSSEPSTEPGVEPDTGPGTEPDSPEPDTEAPPDSSEDVVEDLETVLESPVLAIGYQSFAACFFRFGFPAFNEPQPGQQLQAALDYPVTGPSALRYLVGLAPESIGSWQLHFRLAQFGRVAAQVDAEGQQ